MCDNQAAIKLSKNAGFSDRTKHFWVHFHWICQRVSEGEIDPVYISTHSKLSDFLNKSLRRIKHNHCVEGINLSGWKWGGGVELGGSGKSFSPCCSKQLGVE
jgi:hypothetical protein